MKTPYFGLFNSKTDECINTCKDGYTVSQNREVVDMVLAGMEPFGKTLKVTKAGSIHGGRKVYLQLEITGTGKVNGDIIKRYVTVIDSNDGSTGLSIGIGDLTMSCQNQFFKFYKKGEAKFRHTSSIEDKIKGIPELIELALNESLNQMKVYQKFASTEVSKNLAHQLVKELLGYDKVYTPIADQPEGKALAHMEDLYSHIDSEMASKGNTLCGVTSWTSHPRQPKKVNPKTTAKRDNWLEETLMTGRGYNYNQDSFKFCVNEAGILLRDNSLVLA